METGIAHAKPGKLYIFCLAARKALWSMQAWDKTASVWTETMFLGLPRQHVNQKYLKNAPDLWRMCRSGAERACGVTFLPLTFHLASMTSALCAGFPAILGIDKNSKGQRLKFSISSFRIYIRWFGDRWKLFLLKSKEPPKTGSDPLKLGRRLCSSKFKSNLNIIFNCSAKHSYLY